MQVFDPLMFRPVFVIGLLIPRKQSGIKTIDQQDSVEPITYDLLRKYFSIRARKVLLRLKVTSWSDIAALGVDDLLEVRNCGQKTANQIIDFMRHNKTQLNGVANENS